MLLFGVAALERGHAALGVVATAAHIISVCLLDAFCIMDPYFGHQLLYMTAPCIFTEGGFLLRVVGLKMVSGP